MDRNSLTPPPFPVDAARGQGLGDTVTRAVTNEAFRRGADPTAALNHSLTAAAYS